MVGFALRLDGIPSWFAACGADSDNILGPVREHLSACDVDASSFKVEHVATGVRWIYVCMRLCASWTEDRTNNGQVLMSAILFSPVSIDDSPLHQLRECISYWVWS